MQEVRGLDRRALDRVRASRDARFDGRFFIAVTSTGIYCRPICPSPTCKNSNVRYYPTAAAAAAAGFRPCLRCRPEAAPGTPAWLGTSAVVRRALRLIHEGALDEGHIEDLATRVGVGSRHLHRLFIQHVGAPPIVVAQTRRLHFAKRLLDETTLPMTEIALAAGFGSLRRFNHTIQETYGRAPRDLRKLRRGGLAAGAHDEVTLRLAYRPPYDWVQVRNFLAERAVTGIEIVEGRAYSRTVATNDGWATIRVEPAPKDHALELRVSGAAPASLFQLSTNARRVFDLAADPALIARALRGDSMLAPLIRRRPGLRIPGAWDIFECGVQAIARTRLARLVARYGQAISDGPAGLTHLFPVPASLMAASANSLGVPASKAAALRAFARVINDKAIDFAAPLDEVTRALAGIPGVGESTAQHIAMRALAEPDAFPSKDHTARAKSWRPWRSYALMHLWCA